MKILEIDPQIEQQLVAILDAALKKEGIQIHQAISSLLSKITEKPAEKPVAPVVQAATE